MQQDCVFCDLISNKRVDFKYATENVVAFDDIDPKAPTHILIVPTRHLPSINSIDSGSTNYWDLGLLFVAASKIAESYGFASDGYRLVVNTGKDAGQTVDHIHMHLLAGEPLGEMNTKEQ